MFYRRTCASRGLNELKSQLSLSSGRNHCINTVVLDRIAMARKVDGGRERHCDVISNAYFSLYLRLIKREIRVYTKWLLTNQKQEPVPSMRSMSINLSCLITIQNQQLEWLLSCVLSGLAFVLLSTYVSVLGFVFCHINPSVIQNLIDSTPYQSTV